MNEENALVVFQGKKIRRTWFNDEWWFSVVDIVGVLTQTDRARKYWSDLKTKLQDEGFEVSEKIGQLKRELEQQSIRKVSTPENYLSEPEKKKKLEDKSKK